MRKGQRTLAKAIRIVLPRLPIGPPLGAFGIAREDCALVHIDYFGDVEAAVAHLVWALAESEGVDVQEIHRELGLRTEECDCPSCIGKEAAEDARRKHRAAYTNVKEWVEATQ